MNFIDVIQKIVIKSKKDAQSLVSGIKPARRKFYFENGKYITGHTDIAEVWKNRRLINAQLKKLRKKSTKSARGFFK